MLGQLLGDQLGVDGFCAMECSFKAQPADSKPAQQWVKTEFVWKLN